MMLLFDQNVHDPTQRWPDPSSRTHVWVLAWPGGHQITLTPDKIGEKIGLAQA